MKNHLHAVLPSGTSRLSTCDSSCHGLALGVQGPLKSGRGLLACFAKRQISSTCLPPGQREDNGLFRTCKWPSCVAHAFCILSVRACLPGICDSTPAKLIRTSNAPRSPSASFVTPPDALASCTPLAVRFKEATRLTYTHITGCFTNLLAAGSMHVPSREGNC